MAKAKINISKLSKNIRINNRSRTRKSLEISTFFATTLLLTFKKNMCNKSFPNKKPHFVKNSYTTLLFSQETTTIYILNDNCIF